MHFKNILNEDPACILSFLIILHAMTVMAFLGAVYLYSYWLLYIYFL